MKKIFLLLVFIFVFILCGQALAEEDEVDIKIIGLENISRKYEAGTDPENIDFVKGLKLYVNEDVLAPEKLLVDYTEVDFKRVGTYKLNYYVLYLVDDLEQRVDITSIDIEIIDTKPPKLEGVKPIIVRVNTNETEIDYLKGIKATDNDLSSSLNIYVDSYNVDLKKVGVYPITYYVKDKSGNETISRSYVSVVEKITQSNLVLNVDKDEFYINVNHHNPIQYYKEAITCFDKDKDITEYVQIIDDSVDYTKIGSYEITFLISDEYGNILQKNVPVNIIEDNEPPIFKNLEDVYVLTINTTDYYKGITAVDEVCGDVTDRIEVDLGVGFRFDVEGEYQATYIVSDYNGNETTKEVIIKVMDNLPPVIEAPESLYIKVNQPIDLTKKISIIDNIDGEILDYTINDNHINISRVGVYFIEIHALDSKGNEAIKKITVYIYDNSVEHFYEHPIFIGSLSGIIISSIISSLSYYKLKRKLRRR